jgi:hypothetical protein
MLFSELLQQFPSLAEKRAGTFVLCPRLGGIFSMLPAGVARVFQAFLSARPGAGAAVHPAAAVPHGG